MSKWGFAAWVALSFAVNAAPVQQLWEKRFDGPAAREDVFSALTVDSAGRVYVTGSSDNNVNPDPYGTVKYDTNGNQLWSARYTGPRAIDVPLTVIVDGQGYVYVTGFSHGLASGYDPDYATLKYAPEGTELWVARYNAAGTNHQSPDNPFAMIVNGAGEVFVTGASMSPEQTLDFATIKYDTNGATLWVARYNGVAGYSDRATAMGMDSAGNIYVCGSSEREDYRARVTLLKYSPSGTQIWERHFETLEEGSDLVPRMKVDPSGEAHIAFAARRGGSEDVSRIVALKYNAEGELVWRTQHRLFHAQYLSEVVAVDLDDTANFVVAVKAGTGGYQDYLVWKISPSGEPLWSSRYNSPSSYHDVLGGMTLDAQGNIYVTGTAYQSGNQYQLATIKLRPNGQREWETTTAHGNNFGMSLSGVQVDAAGHVYVGGSTGPVGTKDYVTIKYRQLPQPGLPEITAHPVGRSAFLGESVTLSVTATGENLNYQWRRDGFAVPNATNSTLVMMNIPSGVRGYYYVDVWNSAGAVASTEALVDVIVPPEITQQPVSRQVIAGSAAEFSVTVTGAEPLSFQWLRGSTPIPGATNTTLLITNVAPSDVGSYVLVATNAAGSATSDPATLSLVPGIEQVFSGSFRQPGQGYSFPQFLRVSADDKAHLAQILQLPGRNEFLTVQFDPAGMPTWAAQYAAGTNANNAVAAADMDGSGNMYLSGVVNSNYAQWVTIVKQSPSGSQLWSAIYDPSRTNTYDTVTAMVVDSAGNAYITGSTEGQDNPRDFLTLKFDSAGVLQWAVRHSLTNDSYDAATSVVVDASGVYVFGASYAQTMKLVTIKYDHAGAMLWTRLYEAGTDAQAAEIKLDAAGNVVVSGSANESGSDADLVTLKYSPNGDLIWKAQYPGMLDAYDYPYAMDLDAAGNIYVAATSSLPNEENTGLSAFNIVKYDAGGNQLWVSSQIAAANVSGRESFAVDAAGNAYLVLGKYSPEGGSDFATSKYDTNGTRLFEAISSRGKYSDEYPAALALTPTGDLFVSGISYSPVSELVLFRYRQHEIVGLPVIVQSPQSRDVRQGTPVTFSVTATGDGLRYQWLFNGRPISGATSSSYTLSSASVNNAGHYAVEVSNDAGTVLTSTAVLSIGVPPEIVRQPQGQSVLPGTAVQFSVGAAGSRPLSYQWRHNGTNIPGAINSELEIPSVQLEDSGFYSVVVSNRAGVVTSAEALLMVTGHARRDWVSLFDEGPPAVTIALDMELDGAQNVYVAGNSWGDPQPTGYLTARFSPAGEQLWDREFAPGSDSSAASGLTVDLAGNVYTVGSAVLSNGVRGVVTVKYDTNGNQLWARQLNGTSMPLGQDIAVSSGGSIYVVGKFQNGSSIASVTTVKYDTNGVQLWSASQALARYTVGDCKLAADSQDGVYVLVNTSGESSGNDVMTIKYNGTGTQLWRRTISDRGDQGPVDIKIDAAGDAIVEAYSRGFTNRGFLTIKYRSTDGQEVWRRTFSLSEYGVDEPSALEVDYSRNIYVTGKTFARTYYDEFGYYHEDEDLLTIKYSPQGELLWAATYGAAAGQTEVGTSIAWDGDNGLYITGATENRQGHWDWLTVRYDTDGNRYWADIYDSPDREHDEGRVVRARFGDAYVLGSTSRGDYGFEQLGLIKYVDVGLADVPRIDTPPQSQTAIAGNNVLLSVGASGPGPLRYQWYHNGMPIPGATGSGLLLPRVEQTNAGNYSVEVSNNAGVAASPDARLNVVIPARITVGPVDQCVVAGSRVEFRIQYEGDGEVWVQWYYNGAPLPGYSDVVPIANVGPTNAGVYSVVVTNEFGSATASARLIITPQATLAWSSRYNSTNTAHDEPVAAVVDGQGNTYILGQSGAGTVTVKFDSSGALAWQRWNVRTSYVSFAATEIALAGDGAVYVAGWVQGPLETEHALTLVKYAPNGDQLWATNYSREDHARPVDMKVDGAGSVLITADAGPDRYNPAEILTLKLDADGNLLWTARLDWSPDTQDSPVAMAVDAAGSVYVTGYTVDADSIEYAQVSDYITVKYDAAGVQMWTAEHNGPGAADDRPSAIAVDGQGNVYVTGSHSHEYWVNSGTTVYFDYDYATIKYDTNGQRLWLAVYASAPRQLDEAVDLKVDGAGNVYVVGNSEGDLVTVKYNPVGQQQWVSRLDSGVEYDVASRLALDDMGNIYITGHSGDYGDILTSRLDPNGSRVWLARFDGRTPASGYSGGSYDYPIAIGLDSARNVYVAGSVEAPITSRDFVALRYTVATSPGSPVITVPPQNTTVSVGSTASMSVTVTGDAPLRYQWRRNGIALAGETSATLEIPGVTFDDAARYSVVVYNDIDCVVSADAILTVGMSEAVQCVHVELAGNATRITIAGPVACTYRIECSGDMLSWHTLGTVYNTSGTCDYLDTTPTAPRRFYRVMKLP
jgi:uncharacterized delta-60 repeat protein